MVNWRERTADGCIELVRDHYKTMNKKELRGIIEVMIQVKDLEALGEALSVGGIKPMLNRIDALEAREGELEHQLKVARDSYPAYLLAAKKTLKYRIDELFNEEMK